MLKILWLSPNFNHYKARFLNHLAEDEGVSLTVLAGSGRESFGDKELQQDWFFDLIKLDVPKKKFGNSKIIKNKLNDIIQQFDWVMVPAEKKNLSLFLFVLKLKKTTNSFRMFSYNHEALKSNNKILSLIDKGLTKYFFKRLDRVIFYSQQASINAVNRKLVNITKAFWANNTIDTAEVNKNYKYQLPPEGEPRILFIGRLIPSKRVSDLLRYFEKLKIDCSNLKLEIIGDGPDRSIVEKAVSKDHNIIWHGTLVEEEKIAPIMKNCSIVFVPGLSGLSINHAFAYGRPYITIKAVKHGPELSYLKHGENGYVLKGIINKDIQIIENLIKDRQKLELFSQNAKQKGEELSVGNWVKQIKLSLLHE